jgi:predicted ribosome quality control (RQC) complex YloA/Tae2 family protein
MLDAATLAVYFSKMRTATQADVTFTNSKYIRRIKGAPPGKVRVERSKTIRVRIEPERLERLLKNK